MIENRGSHGVVAIGHVLYAIGGGGLHSNLSSNEKLTCTTDNEAKWSRVSSMPTARHALVVVKDEKSIFAIGGWIDGKICSPHIEKYDTETDMWTSCSPMTVGRRLLGAAVLAKKIYVFGGSIDFEGHCCRVLEIYDITNDVWTRGKDLPIAGREQIPFSYY